MISFSPRSKQLISGIFAVQYLIDAQLLHLCRTSRTSSQDRRTKASEVEL